MESSKRTVASKARYWKDRLEEQIDYALGLHDDGAYYNSWEQQLGGMVGQRKRKRRDNRGSEKPGRKNQLWEDDTNLMSLLLGRNPRGAPLKWDVSDYNRSCRFIHSLIGWLCVFYLT